MQLTLNEITKQVVALVNQSNKTNSTFVSDLFQSGQGFVASEQNQSSGINNAVLSSKKEGRSDLTKGRHRIILSDLKPPSPLVNSQRQEGGYGSGSNHIRVAFSNSKVVKTRK